MRNEIQDREYRVSCYGWERVCGRIVCTGKVEKESDGTSQEGAHCVKVQGSLRMRERLVDIEKITEDFYID